MTIAMSLFRRWLALPAGVRRSSTERAARAERIVLEQLDVACRTARRLGVPAAPASRGAAVRILVVPRGDELSVGAGGSAAPLDAAVQAWEFLRDVGTPRP